MVKYCICTTMSSSTKSAHRNKTHTDHIPSIVRNANKIEVLDFLYRVNLNILLHILILIIQGFVDHVDEDENELLCYEQATLGL